MLTNEEKNQYKSKRHRNAEWVLKKKPLGLNSKCSSLLLLFVLFFLVHFVVFLSGKSYLFRMAVIMDDFITVYVFI